MNDELLQQLSNAPQWALTAGTAGRWLIYGGIGFFAASLLLWILQGIVPKISKLATAAFFAGCAAILGAFGCLISLFAADQFEYKYVIFHADKSTDLKYKIAGVWSAQEGSFLLWASAAALFGMLAFRGAGKYRRWFTATFSVFLGSLCGILAYESPFNLLDGVTLNGVVKLPHGGQGLTPALQNYWVIIHPPTIFMGFGSLTVMFALSVAAMLNGDTTEWAKIARPWTLVSVSILGLGLCMGGMWAYETQGWGGFWMWDPVENVSFVPWLFTAALLHGLIVQATRKRWVRTNLFLAGMPFLTFVYGTFLTRSGLLDKLSVHSFAEMDRGALVILKIFLSAICLAFLVLFLAKAAFKIKDENPASEQPGIDRESAYMAGTLLLSLLAVGIGIGMSWPWFSALRTGTGAAIEEKQYHPVVVWFFVPIMILMAVGPFITWKKEGVKTIFQRMMNVLSLAAGVTGFSLVAIQNPKIGVHMPSGSYVAMPFHTKFPLMVWMAVLLFVCVFTVVANLWRAVELFKRSKLGIGGFVAHIGLAVLMTGLIISRGFEQRDSGIVDPGAGATKILDYKIAFKGLHQKSPEDRDGYVEFSVEGPDGQKFTATPGLYYYPGDDGSPTAMVWPYVDKHFAHDFYMAMNKPVIYAWDKPLEFEPGQTRIIKPPVEEDNGDPGMSVTYEKFVMQGAAGMAGTSFGAKLHIVDGDNQYDVTPALRIGSGDLQHDLAPVGRSYRMAMLGIDPKTKNVQLQLLFSPPLYPIVLFYKPMTILVWVGTGVMTLGGLMAAWSRRYRTKVLEAEPTV